MQAIEPDETSEQMSRRVIDVLASVTGSDPVSMTPPLYDVIDPDALNRLLETDTPVEIQFEYRDHAVVAKSDGTVSIDGVIYTAGNARSPSPAIGEQVHNQD